MFFAVFAPDSRRVSSVADPSKALPRETAFLHVILFARTSRSFRHSNSGILHDVKRINKCKSADTLRLLMAHYYLLMIANSSITAVNSNMENVHLAVTQFALSRAANSSRFYRFARFRAKYGRSVSALSARVFMDDLS